MIQIQVKSIKEGNYDGQGAKLHKADAEDISIFKVNINDKISKISDYLAMEDISGCITYKGKLIDKPGDVSFAKMFIHDNDQFAVISSSGGDPIIWKRFP